MNLDDTFHRSLKPLAVEEFLDYYFYRRVAHRMVPFLHRLGLSPDQVTTLSLLFGLMGAFAAWKGFFPFATALCLVAIFLDCCDGQIARLTGKVSPLGRVMDGFFDMLWGSSLWFAVYFSGYFQARGFPNMLALMIPAAASMFLHCWRFDAAKIKLLEMTGEKAEQDALDIYDARRLFDENLRRFNPLAVLLAACLMFQMFFFVRGTRRRETFPRTPEETARLKLRIDPLLDDWSWLGEGHHNTLILIGLFAAPWTPYPLLAAFWILLVPMNAWWLSCETRTARALAELRNNGA